MPDLKDTRTGCTTCGTPDAPHLGEMRTTQAGEGVTRSERARRCTPCQQRHRGVLPSAIGAHCASGRHHDCTGTVPYGNGLWVRCSCTAPGCLCALATAADRPEVADGTL